MSLRLVARVLPWLVFLPATLAVADDVWVFPGRQVAVTLSREVLEALTSVRSSVPKLPPRFSLVWSGKGNGGVATTLELDFTLGPSSVNAEAQFTLVDVRGILTVDRESGREAWHVSQSNVRRFFARAEWTARLGRVTLLLPVAFSREGATTGEPLHALLLVPCRLSGATLSCGNARYAFGEMVQQEFPHQPKVEDVLPIYRDDSETVTPESSDSVRLPPQNEACCFGDSGIAGLCWYRCLLECPFPPCGANCPDCFAHECVNCSELSCSSCG